MKCQEFREYVSLLVSAEVDTPEREACARHMAECGECKELMIAMERTQAAVRRLARGDAARAEAALEGFEARVLERRRKERMAAALGGGRESRLGRPGALRWALGLSLAVNVCAALVFGLGYWGPRGGGPGQAGKGLEVLRTGAALRVLPAGLPHEDEMRGVYGELEELFGNRLNWVAQSGGDVSMGVISDPDESPGAKRQGPLVALVYWMSAEGKSGGPGAGAESGGGRPVVILTRAGGGEIRQQAALGPGRAPVEIAVDSLRARRGGFAIQTQVRPVAEGTVGKDSVSALAAEVSVKPGEPAKLGEVRVGDRMMGAYLAVQVLGGAEARGKTAS